MKTLHYNKNASLALIWSKCSNETCVALFQLIYSNILGNTLALDIVLTVINDATAEDDLEPVDEQQPTNIAKPRLHIHSPGLLDTDQRYVGYWGSLSIAGI